MASHLVGQHPITTFTSPVAGTSPIDANVVRGNDNTIKIAYSDGHDQDATIHVQDSILGSRPVAGVAGRKWLTTDASAFYLFYDDGTSWNEISYLRSTGGTITGQTTIVSTTTPQLTVEYDGLHTATFSVSSAGALTINATTTVTITPATTITGALTQTGLATFNGSATIASGQTLTVTGATITGLTAASVATGTFPGVYTVTGALTLSAALTYGGVTLSNAVTGTGSMVLSASPTFTGTVTAATLNATTLGGTLSTASQPNITTLGSALTTGTINGQTINSAANLTGTLAIASTLAVGGASFSAQAGFTKIGVNTNTQILANGGAGSISLYMQNAEYVGSNVYNRISADLATRYYQTTGTHNWDTAITSTAGSAISWVTGMSLTASAFTVSAATTAVQALTATTGLFNTTSTANILTVQNLGIDSNPNISIINDAKTWQLQTVGLRSDAFELWDSNNSRTVISASASTGAVTFVAGISATTGTFSGALTYGGVTLSNAVTGTGNMVLSASPTLSGTVVVANLTVTAGVSLANPTIPNGSQLTFLTALSVIVPGATSLNFRDSADANTNLSISDAGRVGIRAGLGLSAATKPDNGIQFGASAPSSLANGQLWYDGTDFKVRVGGATKTVTVA